MWVVGRAVANIKSQIKRNRQNEKARLVRPLRYALTVFADSDDF